MISIDSLNTAGTVIVVEVAEDAPSNAPHGVRRLRHGELQLGGMVGSGIDDDPEQGV